MPGLATAHVSSFWYWITERHAIYERRQAGQPKPWTHDPILRAYKFTNPFRQNDTGTVWLTKNFLDPHREVPHDADCPELLQLPANRTADCQCTEMVHHLSTVAFNICWYRMFNWTGTGELLGWQTDWNEAAVVEKLSKALAEGKQVFTGAHIVRSAFGVPKIDSIAAVCSDLHHMCYTAGALVTCVREEKSLQRVFDMLLQVDYVGPFMAYEMVTDMRWTPLLDDAHDINTWANAGPGALRGLERLQMPRKNQREANASMRELLEQSREALTTLPALEMRDIEHSLCEFDKYMRIKSGEGKPRGRYPGV